MKTSKKFLYSNKNLQYTIRVQKMSTGSLIWSSNQNSERFLVTGGWQGIRCGRSRCVDDRDGLMAKYGYTFLRAWFCACNDISGLIGILGIVAWWKFEYTFPIHGDVAYII